MQRQDPSPQSSLSQRLSELLKPTMELEEGLLISATYDGDKRTAVLKFYDPKNDRVWLWYDDTGHKPYCYTKLPMEELAAIGSRKDITIESAERLDLLADSKITVRKIIAPDPLAIGGSSGNSVRDEIRAWEADIKYYENYIYDKGFLIGTYYRISQGMVSPIEKEMPELVSQSLGEILAKSTGESSEFIRRWAELLGQPLCSFKRIAADIEVANEENRVPDPEKADREIIAVSFYNESESLVYLYSKGGDVAAPAEPTPYRSVVFPNEAEMLRAVFSKMLDYPMLVTFNGDDFDLRYLKHRAENLGVKEAEIPIQLQRQEASLKHGIHIDLYRVFNNRSIQIYVYGNRYSEHTLNGISEALLGKSKVEFEGNIAELPLAQLANYCLNDSQLTYELTSGSSSLLMKILLVISRIAKMPMNDAARLGVSNWIRSMLFYEHRRIGALIPRTDELAEKGGASSEAIIKGKKYKGGLVIEPKPGVHFGVSVLDFASLYPSIIKVYNLSYETVNCPHPECRTNSVPDTTHWVCRKRKGITSLVIGSLRDLRVSHYKQLAKDQKLSKEDRELYAVASQGLKVILNAGYGVMGFETFALYCLPVAEATAALGRYAITKTIDKCRELAINVIYSDSITAERCVTLQDPRGIIRVMPVEEFFDSSGSFVTRHDGKDHVEPRGWKALSVNPKNGVGEFKPVRAVIRHKTAKKVYRVFEKWGCTRVTEDHSLLAIEGGRPVLAKPTALIGRHLLRVDRIPSVTAVDTIDVYSVMKPYVYNSTYKGRRKLLQAHCDDEWVWYGWTNRKVPIKVKRFIRLGTPEFSALLELLGAYIAEGSSSTPETTKSRMGASVACSDTEWLYRLRDNYILMFRNTTPSIVLSNGGTRHLAYRGSKGQLIELDYEDRTRKMQMMNELSAVFFRAFCGQKRHGKEIPSFVYHIPREHKRIFLENMVKGDGSRALGPGYTDEYRQKNFRYETKSVKLAGGLSVLLSQLGIKYTLRYRESKQTYSFATSEKYNRRTSTPVVIREPYGGYVYDLSVDDNHTFVDSCGNVALKNTDSLFIENPVKDQVSKVAKWAEDELGVELDIDKVYRYVAFSERKKNYFGMLQDGTPDIKGLTGKKSQTPEFLKKTFYEALDLLEKVYAPQDFERARTSIKALLTRMVSQLRNREIPVDQLAFNVMIGKSIAGFSGTTPQHVKAAKLMQDRGKEIKAGDIISYVKTKTPPNVKPAGLARPEEIDVDKYLEYAQSMFDQMLDSLGFSFDEIMGSTTLDLFWS